MFDVHDLHAGYGRIPILNGISFMIVVDHDMHFVRIQQPKIPLLQTKNLSRRALLRSTVSRTLEHRDRLRDGTHQGRILAEGTTWPQEKSSAFPATME